MIAFVCSILYLKGADPSPLPAFKEPAIWMPFIGTGALVGLVVLFPALRSAVVAFEFDARTRQLTYTQDQAFRILKTKIVSFEFIEEITPILLKPNALEGYFEVTVRTPRGARKLLKMGFNDIPIERLNEHAKWLSSHLGDRVKPEISLDC